MSSSLAVCSGLIVGRLIFCLAKQEHYGPRSLFFTGLQINDCFYLIEFNGVLSPDWQCLYCGINLSGHAIRANASANLDETHVSYAYGKDFICSFQDDAQKKRTVRP